MQTEFRSLYEITGKITDHNMLVVPAAKLKALTLYEKLAEEYGLSIFPDLEALAAEIALLRTGYAAARLEIESLQARIKTMAEEHADELMVAHLDGRMRAAQPAGAQQPGAAYAALPYKQALGSKNCMQCCVSYMLGLPLESVPDFATDGGWELFSEFVESKGYAAVMLPGNREFEADYLASGTTERGTSHMVVMNDGKLVHDPHPSNAGLVEVQCVWLLAKRATPRAVHADEQAAFEAVAKADTSNVSFIRDDTGYVDMTAALLWHGWKLRASHGQAPAQAAPAAVAVPTFEDFCKRHGLDPKKMDGHGGMWARVALDECRAITAQPAPQPASKEQTMTEPTDAEIVALADATRTAEGGANGYILPISFARAVLAKWGSPQPVVREPLSDEEVDSLCKVGFVYVIDGKVTRTPTQYREELKAAQRYGLRKGEHAHGIKGGQRGTE